MKSISKTEVLTSVYTHLGSVIGYSLLLLQIFDKMLKRLLRFWSIWMWWNQLLWVWHLIQPSFHKPKVLYLTGGYLSSELVFKLRKPVWDDLSLVPWQQQWYASVLVFNNAQTLITSIDTSLENPLLHKTLTLTIFGEEIVALGMAHFLQL